MQDELAGRRETPAARRQWRLRAIAAGVMIALAAAMVWSYYEDPSRKSTRLLAQVYTARREFDWRLPDGGWAQSRVQRRGSAEGPSALFEAQAILARGQAGREGDPQWLDLRARAEMLDRQFDPAIVLLQQTVAASPNSADFLTDLAVAYGLNAESRDRPAEFAAAVEFSTRALTAEPQHRRARFNRAIAFERLHMVDQAIDDWERYLTLESDAAWRKEAGERLQQLRTIQNRRAQLMRSDEESDAVLDTKAVVWLAQDRAKARDVGRLLLANYGEAWLAEAAQEPVDSAPLLLAVQAVAEGQADEALDRSQQAARLYAERSAPAHLARAQMEGVNALNRSMRPEQCRDLAANLERMAEARKYHWIRIQALLQQSACRTMLGELGEGSRQKREAIRLAHQYKIAGLEFRAIGLYAATQTVAGDLWAAWRANLDALGRLAGSPYSLNRLNQYLDNYSSSAELWGWRAASFEFMRAAADALRDTPNRMTEAVDRARAAALAVEARMYPESREEAQKAEDLFRSLPSSDTKTRYLNSVRLLEGESYLLDGQFAEATRVLAPIADAEIVQREQWRAHQFLGLSLLRTEGRSAAIHHLQTAADLLDKSARSLPRASQRSQARRTGLAAYRDLADVLLEEDPSGARSLRVWLAAHESTAAPDLVFLASENGYIVWTQNGARVHKLVLDRSRIRQSISKLLKAASDPSQPGSEIQSEGRFLFDQLLRPVLSVMPSGGVFTVLPDAEIASLPFPLLVDPQGRWLGEYLAMVLTARPKPTESWSPPRRALIVGAPATQEPLPPLPDSRVEAEAIAVRYAGSTILMGPEATDRAVTLRLADADLFHYSGHGYSGASVGGLYLADSLLTSASLQDLSLPACRLAVLSACMTAVGQTDGLTNPESLVHALLDAGVRTVIASRWFVDSAATAALMAHFYANLDSLGDPAQALRIASETMRAEAKYRHPYYWAAFQTYQ